MKLIKLNKLLLFLILILLLITFFKYNNIFKISNKETFVSLELPKELKSIKTNINKNRRKMNAILNTVTSNSKDTFRNINRIIRN